jgi:hypothetical protein
MKRSTDPRRPAHDPIGCLLEALERARYEGSMEALVLADGHGLVIAGAGAVWLCEELAAQAPFVAASTPPANDVLPNSLDALERTRWVRIHVDGVELLMCGRGGNDERGLLAAARSARRLLSGRREEVRVREPISAQPPRRLDSPTPP